MGESDNLLIASAGEDRAGGLEWMKLEPANRQQVLESRWPWSEKKKPEYDLEITVLGEKSEQPHAEQFTLRAGSHSALEMFRRYLRIDSPTNESEIAKRECTVKGSVGIPRATVELFVHAGGQWHSPSDTTVTGESWKGTCWLGNQESVKGEFAILAIADGEIGKGKFKDWELANRGFHSAPIKVRLNRVIPTPRP